MAKISEMLNAVRKGGALGSQMPLKVHAYVEVPSKSMPSMMKFDKEEHDRVAKEVKGIQQALDEWVPEDVAAKAKKALENELEIKKARLMECKARMKQHDDEESEPEEDDEAEEGE